MKRKNTKGGSRETIFLKGSMEKAAFLIIFEVGTKKNARPEVRHHENEFYNSLTKTYTRNLAINVPKHYQQR